jgi:hypothetical protein
LGFFRKIDVGAQAPITPFWRNNCMTKTMDYSEYLDSLIYKGEICAHCPKKAQTLHHKDENRDNNHISNLLPLCFSCHEKIEHVRSIFDKQYYVNQNKFSKVTFNRQVKRLNRIETAKLIIRKPKISAKGGIKKRTNKTGWNTCAYVNCKIKSPRGKEYCTYLCESKALHKRWKQEIRESK